MGHQWELPHTGSRVEGPAWELPHTGSRVEGPAQTPGRGLAIKATTNSAKQPPTLLRIPPP
eukprot:2297797-Amphidinium_carterae.1